MASTKESHVLIVDDDPVSIRVMLETLRGECRAMIARSGAVALKMSMGEPRPDLILLDVVMPGMSGYEVCQQLKLNPLVSDIPVIFVTSTEDRGEEARGLDIGAVDYIHKPYDFAIVRARVRVHLENKLYRDMLENLVRQRTEEISKVQEATIHALASAAEWRDPETGGHIRRTQNYIKTLATRLSAFPRYRDVLTSERIEVLYRSAPLHDVGKISIPDDILLKPAKLDESEMAIMRNHALFGANLLKEAQTGIMGSNPFLECAHEIAAYHHERWDGTGYPNGLKGDAIPLSALLMAVADVYDALISERVYKKPIPHDIASDMISQASGSQFAPFTVEAFQEICDEFKAISLKFSDDS